MPPGVGKTGTVSSDKKNRFGQPEAELTDSLKYSGKLLLDELAFIIGPIEADITEMPVHFLIFFIAVQDDHGFYIVIFRAQILCGFRAVEKNQIYVPA